MSYKKDREMIIFQIIAYVFVTAFVFFCLVPFILIISASLTPEKLIYTNGYALIPKQISFTAYSLIFKSPGDILRSYAVTLLITATGTLTGLFITSMTAYVLNKKDFKYRNKFSFFYYFTMLFSGGLVPFYILIVRYLQMKDTLYALILPSMLNAWYILLMRNFMNTIPYSVVESGKVDGAGEFRIFLRIVLPMSKPALATIGLFVALQYWNDWYLAMLFINSKKLMPLQYFLYNMLNSMQFIYTAIAKGAFLKLPDMPAQSIKMATAIVVTGPIIFLYPFVQKYFVKGITIGAVKG